MGFRLRAALLLAIVSGIGCAGPLRSPPRTDDPGIASLISLRLSADPRLCPFQITVNVYGGTARLEGKVSSDADRRRADRVAREAGAARVQDFLTVDPAAGDGAGC